MCVRGWAFWFQPFWGHNAEAFGPMADKNKEEVSASQNGEAQPVSAEEQQIADAVAASQQVADAAQQEEQQPETPAPLTRKDLEDSFNSFQGRQSNYTAKRLREMEERLDKKFAPVVGHFEAQQRVTQLQRKYADAGLETEQIETLIRRDLAEMQPAAKPAADGQAESPYTPAETERLRGRVEALLDTSALKVAVSDGSVWQGYSVDMTADEAYALAKTNVKKLVSASANGNGAQPSRPAPQQRQPRQKPPPSTQDAPASNSRGYETKTDLVQAFREGKINSDQYSAALAELAKG